MLKCVLSLGVKIQKINRVISFSQSKWMKPFLEFNTNNRMHSKSSFENDLYKLMINSVYGKTMDNILKHTDINLRYNPIS